MSAITTPVMTAKALTQRGVPESMAGSLRDIVSLSIHDVFTTYAWGVPKLWSETIETHREAVREATLDATAALVAKRGLRSVTMSEIAQTAGIGRATLYKYFPDVETILVAWHERQVKQHLHQLARLRDAAGPPDARLRAVLEAYALIQHEHAGSDLGELLHGGPHVVRARQHLCGFLAGLLADAAAAGRVRDDVNPEELASYCLNALVAATSARSKSAVLRLVDVTLSGLRSTMVAGPAHGTGRDAVEDR